MPQESRIFVTCGTHPRLFKARSFSVSEKHRYAPPSVEAEILQSIEKSSASLLLQLKKKSQTKDLKQRIDAFKNLREKFLGSLVEIPEVSTFINYVLFLESEVEKDIDLLQAEREIERILTGERTLEERDVEEEESTEEPVELSEKEYDNLLDAIEDAVNRGRVEGSNTIENSLREYVGGHEELLRWLLEANLDLSTLGINRTEYQALLANLITVDTLLVANNKYDLGTERSIMIPLDFSPLRILLSIDAANREWNRMTYPPLLLLWSENVSQLSKPYRTIDGHPMMVYVPEFGRTAARAQEEIRRAFENFQEEISPLISSLKGLTPLGKRDTAPIFIREPLVSILSGYLQYNPMCMDNLKVADLGCGSGSLLKDIFGKLMEKGELGQQLFIQTLLNDITANLGSNLIRDSQREEFSSKLELYVWKGDMRDLIEQTHQAGEVFDVVFINRAFDLYGGYGIFRFGIGPEDRTQIALGPCEMLSLDLSDKIITFPQALVHEEVWRSVNYLLMQTIETAPGVAFLPAVEMNMLKNFFTWKGKDGHYLFGQLLSIAKLLAISVFPGSFDALFPAVKDKDRIFNFSVNEDSSSYSIICISRDKALIDFLRERHRASTT